MATLETFAWRCESCDVDWPYGQNFRECPVCEQRTSQTQSYFTLTWSDAKLEAERLIKWRDDHRAFEAYYEERELKAFRESLEAAKY